MNGVVFSVTAGHCLLFRLSYPIVHLIKSRVDKTDTIVQRGATSAIVNGPFFGVKCHP